MNETTGISTDERDLFVPRRWRLIWAMSFAVWIVLGFIATGSVVELYRGEGSRIGFKEAVAMEFSQLLPFAPLTPLVFVLVARYPIRRRNWLRRSLLYTAGGIVFTAGHVLMRGFTPYGVYDPKIHGWRSAFWDYKTHALDVQWHVLGSMFFVNAFDDITGTYLPIVLVAYVASYYSRLKDRDRRAAELETQLAKANLQALKSQLQPHFLFNTMHSISGLMFTDVRAADTMMSRLSDLLRMSLEDGSDQITTLNRELEFANGYLEIEKVRFGDRMSVNLDISPETLDAQVPHLLLQPLVENAVQHGIAKLSSKGAVSISSRQNGESLWLTIWDNGPGYDGGDGLQSNTGVGISASQERLRTLYGADQSLTFRIPPNGGTEVTIRIPFRLSISAEHGGQEADESRHCG
jgi:two-component sensor histidine kinase